MSSRTVRDVMVEWLGDDESAIADVLRDLHEVLSTGEAWVSRDLPAEQVAAGDVIADKRGRLWSVTTAGPVDGTGPAVGLVIVRGEAVKPLSLDPWHGVVTLVRRDDARALALLERELGATSVAREVRA